MNTNFYPKYTEGKLHPQSQKILEEITSTDSKPLNLLTIQEVRDNFFNPGWLGSPVEGIAIETRYVTTGYGRIPLRIYTPEAKATLPTLIFFHGGGFVACKVEEFDCLCSRIAAGALCKVISVDYRLAPENKFPAAIEDVENTLRWIAAHGQELQIDLSGIAVAGDSAGGNLAVNASILAKEKNILPISLQILICPWLNLADTENRTYQLFGTGPWLSKTSILWYREKYLNASDEASLSLASPFFHEDIRSLPPTFIINAEFDVLREAGERFAQKLAESAVPVKCSLYKGMLHDFITLPNYFDDAATAIEEICGEINNL